MKHLSVKLSDKKFEDFQKVKKTLGLERDGEVLRYLITDFLKKSEDMG